MKVYCFDIDGHPEWPNGTAVVARDRRTASTVVLYRSLDPGYEQDHAQAALEQRRRALAVLAAPSSSHPSTHPVVELFTCNGFLALAAPDVAAAVPALEKLRAEGLFRVAQPPPLSTTPPLPVTCSRCHEAWPLNSAGLCANCATPKQKPPQPIKPKPSRSRAWIGVLLLILIAILLYAWWPKQPEPKPVVSVIAPIAHLSASRQSVRKGSRVLLSWSTEGLSNLSISPGIGRVAGSGKRWVVISHDTTFTLYGTGTSSSSPVTTNVTVAVARVADATSDSPPSPSPDPGESSAPQASPSASETTPAIAPTATTSMPTAPRPQYQPNQPPAVSYQISAALDSWAAAYRANDPGRQAALYAPQVERFFLHQNVTSDYVRSYMTTFYARKSHFTTFSYTTPQIVFTSDDTATVNFVKSYILQIASGELRNVTSRSEIHLVRIGGRWLINFERDFKG